MSIVTRKLPSSSDIIQKSIRRHLIFGTLVVLLLFGVAGGWATITQISGAVVAPGQLVVEGNVKKVQHPTGGVVGKLLVKDGDHVKANDILVKLDETSAKANLAILNNSIVEFSIRRARLVAELQGANEFEISAALKSETDEGQIEIIVAQEKAMLSTRYNSRQSLKSQLIERINQLRDEIGGLEDQVAAKQAEAKIVDAQLNTLEKLYGQKLAPLQRVEDAHKEVARLKGEVGSLTGSIAQTKGKISETNLQILQIDQDNLTEVSKELRETESKLSEVSEHAVAARDQLQRIDIRAPQDGVIYQLSVHNVGGVIGPGEAIMTIVPEGGSLSVEAKISPTDIDQVFVGQNTNLKFSAFNQRTTPEASGQVEFVSPDLVVDPHTGAGYYVTRIKIKTSTSDLKLVPGMPVEAFINTGNRSVLSYIVKPLSDQIARAFKET